MADESTLTTIAHPELSPEINNDSDNASLSSGGTDYASLRSSVLDYEYENGRRYQSYRKGEYLFPNDADEQDRMDFLHHIYSMIFGGKLHLAPLENFSGRILDLGTGTGIWAIDFADEHPAAEVIGNDLSPIQPGWVPPNCVFEVDDFEADWHYTKPFDFIHGRSLAGAVKDMDRLTKQAFENLKPGGYLELKSIGMATFCDGDQEGYLKKAPSTNQMCRLIHEASSKFGKQMQDFSGWEESLKAAGFVDIVADVVKVPMSAWPKDPKQRDIGRFTYSVTIQGFHSLLPKLLVDILGWTPLEVTVLISKVKQELADVSIHQYFKLYSFYARKPVT
ncbi:hypothetical protein ASPZODRAFT_20461 [Penicilliopsis zonata CBS 506.65]|uniref:Methyltransferase domain-containing protein n=1 Tax=Penicilliopsis zonata CBS 506.65 TaxID=1073090 RepID=A0A1L9S5R3_9EURO|nr:hypothetical protein ASPZODRAFT_20461 [Penicilliopsis zonata CBS 506.65]OJJ42495.1 hypothetical protein ASPZODRAFT_20461 [Penicilliopsis zonata CBS 506.65]